MGFCRERLSLSPGPECPAAAEASGQEGGKRPAPETGQQSQSRHHGSADGHQNKENSEAAGQLSHLPALVPSLLGKLPALLSHDLVPFSEPCWPPCLQGRCSCQCRNHDILEMQIICRRQL